MADAAVRVLADADHERAGRALGAPAQRRCASTATTCGGRRAAPRRAVASRCCAARADGAVDEVLAAPCTAPAPRVHEYGGGAWWVRDGVLWFADWATQRLHRVDPGGEPVAAHARARGATRPALRRRRPCSPDGTTLLCVQEEHHADGREATNTIVRLAAHEPSTPEVVVAGPDFVSDPRWRPDGDGVLLARVGPPRHAVGRHPPRGRRGRRRARSWRAATSGSRSASRRGRPTARCGSSATARGSGACTGGRRAAGSSRWSTSARTSASRSGCSASRCFAFLDDGRVVFALQRRRARAARGARARTPVASRPSTCPTRSIDQLRARGRRAVYIAASPTTEPHVVAIDVDTRRRRRASCRRATSGSTPTLVLGARADRVPDGRRRHRARAALPADQPRGDGARRASGRRCSS